MAQRAPNPVMWILAAIGAIVVLIVAFVFLASTASVLLLLPLIALSVLIPIAFSIIAFIDLWKIVRDHNQGRWDTVDVLWAVGFFVFQVIGPLVWLLVGRSTRLRELGVGVPPKA